MLGIKQRLKRLLLRIRWEKEHPGSIPMSDFNPDLVSMGKWSYGELNITSFNNQSRLMIGSFVSIAQNVRFLLDVEHQIKAVSTYPFKNKVLSWGDEADSKGDIVIEDDVWIGYGATILSGVHIGQGAIIASEALVCKDVAPYEIVGGVPARQIRYRFDEDIRKYLYTLDYRSLTKEMIKEHIELLYRELENMTLEEIMEAYRWFPKKAVDRFSFQNDQNGDPVLR